MYKKILVPVDGSDLSRRAVHAAIKIAKGQSLICEVVLLHVMTTTFSYADAARIIEVLKENERRGQEILSESKKLFHDFTIRVETVFEVGNPAEKIVLYAKEGKYDLVVMGSRGLGAISEVILGSVTHKVLHLVPCPVLVVK